MGTVCTYNCGFWVDNSEEGIKNGLLKLLKTSDNELIEMGKRGKELVENKYLWEKITLKTIELYDWVLNSGTKPDSFIQLVEESEVASKPRAAFIMS